jgi:hypothetical protein
MALQTTEIPSGLHHAKSEGAVIIGNGFGEVSGVGAAQLCRFLLPFEDRVTEPPGFEDQFYVTFKSVDSNISAAALDAQQFETDPTTGRQIVRLRLDVNALPAIVQVIFEAHQSVGR